MPGMNGPEFIRLVRAQPTHATTPIILYTAIEDKTFIENAMEKGANEVWIKIKISLDQMHERIDSYLKNKTT